MTFKTNFSKLALLSNEKIKIYFENKTVEFVPPNIKLCLLDVDFQMFLSMTKQTLEENKDFIQSVGFVVENEYELLLAILKLNIKNNIFFAYWSNIFPNLVYNNSNFWCEDIALSFEEYSLLIEMLLVSCGDKPIEPLLTKIDKNIFRKEADILENTKLSEAEEKLKKAKMKKKESKKEVKQDTKGSSITIDQIVIAILYEFKNLSLDDIFNMNLFTLLEFWKYVSKVVDNQIQIEAAGNGNIKKFTYFIN